jgi:hypothetical protein
MGPPALLPIRRKVCCGLLSPLKIIALAEFKSVTLGSSGKHTNHYTTEATSFQVNMWSFTPDSPIRFHDTEVKLIVSSFPLSSYFCSKTFLHILVLHLRLSYEI